MGRWTVSVGDKEIVIETTPDGPVSIDIPAGGPILADRRSVEDLRTKLGAAIADAAEEDSP